LTSLRFGAEAYLKWLSYDFCGGCSSARILAISRSWNAIPFPDALELERPAIVDMAFDIAAL
jgi:hypothetical protein